MPTYKTPSKIAELGAAENDASAATLVITLTAGAPVGSLVTVGIGADDNFAVTGVTDSRGNTYGVVSSAAAANISAELWASNVTTALQSGDTITVTWGGSNPDRAATATAWDGIKTSSPVDRTSANAAKSTNCNSGDTLTTQQDVELAVGCFHFKEASTDIVSRDNGFTAASYGSTASWCLATQFKILMTTQVVQSKATLGGGRDYAHVVGTFYAAEVTGDPYGELAIGSGMAAKDPGGYAG